MVKVWKGGEVKEEIIPSVEVQMVKARITSYIFLVLVNLSAVSLTMQRLVPGCGAMLYSLHSD